MRESVPEPRQWFTASDITDTKRGHVSSSYTRCCETCRRVRLLLAVSVLVLLGLAAVQLGVTLQRRPLPEFTCPPPIIPRALPCQALPLGFLEQHPHCANVLLDAMNVTNVRVLTYEELFAEALAESGAGAGVPRQPDQLPATMAAPVPDTGVQESP